MLKTFKYRLYPTTDGAVIGVSGDPEKDSWVR